MCYLCAFAVAIVSCAICRSSFRQSPFSFRANDGNQKGHFVQSPPCVGSALFKFHQFMMMMEINSNMLWLEFRCGLFDILYGSHRCHRTTTMTIWRRWRVGRALLLAFLSSFTIVL